MACLPEADRAGTPAVWASTSAYKVPFSGGSIAPVREIDQLAETDASRDQGVSFARSGGVEGTPECYVRDASIGALLFYALGADAPTGTTNFTHVLTPANSIPYVTFWRDIADTLFEQYQDCFVSSLTIRAGAGDPLTAAIGVNGLQSTRLTTDPTITPAIPLQSGYVYNYNDATVTLAGGATALVSSFELTIDNNVTRQQTDAFVPYDVLAGQRQVSLSFDLIFETLTEYNKFHYGGAAGTAQSSAIYTTSADFQFDNGANNQIKFTLPSIAYEEFPVEPNTGGDPITPRCARSLSARPRARSSRPRSRTRSRPTRRPSESGQGRLDPQRPDRRCHRRRPGQEGVARRHCEPGRLLQQALCTHGRRPGGVRGGLRLGHDPVRGQGDAGRDGHAPARPRCRGSPPRWIGEVQGLPFLSWNHQLRLGCGGC
jgi:hypothetical protein